RSPIDRPQGNSTAKSGETKIANARCSKERPCNFQQPGLQWRMFIRAQLPFPSPDKTLNYVHWCVAIGESGNERPCADVKCEEAFDEVLPEKVRLHRVSEWAVASPCGGLPCFS